MSWSGLRILLSSAQWKFQNIIRKFKLVFGLKIRGVSPIFTGKEMKKQMY